MSTYAIGTAGEQVVVEPTFNAAMKEFAEIHKELSQMPQDPKDKLSGLNTMLTDLGVDVSTDYSMILMAGMEQAALGAIMAESAISMAIDVATSAFAQVREDKHENAKPSASAEKNRKSVKSVFDRYRKPAVTAAAQPKKRPNFATSMLMAGSRTQAAPTIQQIKRRQELKGRMAKVGNDLRDLAILKAMGITYATRMDVFDATIGQKRSMLVQTFAGQKTTLTPERKKATLSQDNSPQPRQDYAARPQRLVMGF